MSKNNFCIINDHGTWTAKFRKPNGKQKTLTTGIKVPQNASEIEKSKYEATKKAKRIVDEYMSRLQCSEDC